MDSPKPCANAETRESMAAKERSSPLNTLNPSRSKAAARAAASLTGFLRGDASRYALFPMMSAARSGEGAALSGCDQTDIKVSITIKESSLLMESPLSGSLGFRNE